MFLHLLSEWLDISGTIDGYMTWNEKMTDGVILF